MASPAQLWRVYIGSPLVAKYTSDFRTVVVFFWNAYNGFLVAGSWTLSLSRIPSLLQDLSSSIRPGTAEILAPFLLLSSSEAIQGFWRFRNVNITLDPLNPVSLQPQEQPISEEIPRYIDQRQISVQMLPSKFEELALEATALQVFSVALQVHWKQECTHSQAMQRCKMKDTSRVGRDIKHKNNDSMTEERYIDRVRLYTTKR
ncbi:hypothetical protein EV368DRAFT_64832 [Lentinula lateritia]|uniref:Uncharacterized protein n=1 Tax=Lentinula aff. lateritia TaxID=2804960 RepID=A0ACC1U2Q0_9AGAR|nr:hypothetical protein F5876DRAFT_64877 [Lentinula aff. lateritia]KAJ3852554.1 hypothetical protein EV368DRAFT_64832 [Lentinula lateritia]